MLGMVEGFRVQDRALCLSLRLSLCLLRGRREGQTTEKPGTRPSPPLSRCFSCKFLPADRISSRNDMKTMKNLTKNHLTGRICICLTLALTVLADQICRAAVVTSTDDSGPGTLREAVANATDGDVITFATAGQISLQSNLDITNSVTIVGPGAGNCTLEFASPDAYLYIAPDVTVSVSGLTFNDSFGSAIVIYSAHLALSNCVVANCAQEVGNGAIYNLGWLTVSGSRFANNGGGAILNELSALVLNSGFTDNRGGAIINLDADLVVNQCTFVGNTSDTGGGGIYSLASTAQVIGSSFVQNSAEEGGAIYNSGEGASATMTVSNCAFDNNWTWGEGGGAIYNYVYSYYDSAGQAILSLNNNTFSANQATGYGRGGAIYNFGGWDSGYWANLEGYSYWQWDYINEGGNATVSLANNTLSGNMAYSGGAIANTAQGAENVAFVHLLNSTLSGNSVQGDTTSLGTSLYNEGPEEDRQYYAGNVQIWLGSTILNGSNKANIINQYGTITSMGYNLCSDNGGGFLNGPADQIYSNPKLGPLQDNGGPTLTHALLDGSPALDKGNNFSAAPYDQRGASFPRTLDDVTIANAPRGDGTDIGAFEAYRSPHQIPVAKCKNVTLPVAAACMANASIDDGSFSPEGEPVTLTQTPPGPYFLGTNLVTLTVTDSAGASASCTGIVTVTPAIHTWRVTSLADNGPGTFREALGKACQGDTINFAVTGTIELASGELLLNQSINIIGPGPELLKVTESGNATGWMFHVMGSNNVVSISGLAITNGWYWGVPGIKRNCGGILNEGAGLSLSNCVVSRNTSGILSSGTLSVTSSTFSGNGAGDGAAIANSGSAVISSSLFTYNQASDHGGAIHNYGDMTISGSSFEFNSALDGGAICNLGSWLKRGTLTITNSGFSYNFASSYTFGGGGIYNYGGALTIASSAFSQNSTSGFGGAILSHDEDADTALATATIVNSSFSYNNAGSAGAIANLGATLWMANCSLGGNRASGAAAVENMFDQAWSEAASSSGANGWVAVAPTATILNCTLAGNTSSEGIGTVYHNGAWGGTLKIGSSILQADSSTGTIDAKYSSPFTSLGYNLSSDNAAGMLNQPTDQINADPMLTTYYYSIFAGSQYAYFSAYVPACGSPAIDRGRNLSGLATDQLGYPRTFDDALLANVPGGDGTDIGAFELQKSCFRPPVAKCQSVIVSADATCTAAASIDSGSFDPDGGPLALTQTPAGPYPLGTNVVTLTATDIHGLSSSVNGLIIVVDTTAPDINCPTNMVADATTPRGAVVTFAATATDACSGPPIFVCQPASGSIFPIGTTTVTCTATDLAGNVSSRQFQVTVLGPRDMLQDLIGAINVGIARPQPLLATLNAALASLQAGNSASAAGQLGAFENQVRAQIAPQNSTLAQTLIEQANQIVAASGLAHH
ncbi:MAG: hypothetical protein C5B50_24045 [Verrucomicrobia bacterium]|nr:MAG: hypothetical protein C5B50_24045 [Verrucomicrobiota bacterium]